MVVPIGHTRHIRYPLFKKYLKCSRTRREVDYEALSSVLDVGQAPHAEVDELPLGLLAQAWKAL